MPAPPLTEAKGLCFSWPAGPAVGGVSLAVSPGEMVALVGPNGAGKSTLLRLLSGFLRPGGGNVVLKGRDLRAWSRRDAARVLALVPQYSDINLPYTVAETVAMARYPYLGPFKPLGPDDRRAINDAMAQAGVQALASRALSQLSGGEFQRVILARALAQEPELIYLDEPTAHLDLSYQVQLFGLLSRFNCEEGTTVVAVLHDLNLAAAYFERVILMSRGVIVKDDSPERVLTAEILSATYGCDVRVQALGERKFIYPATNLKGA